jgi:hypothetical protein
MTTHGMVEIELTQSQAKKILNQIQSGAYPIKINTKIVSGSGCWCLAKKEKIELLHPKKYRTLYIDEDDIHHMLKNSDHEDVEKRGGFLLGALAGLLGKLGGVSGILNMAGMASNLAAGIANTVAGAKSSMAADKAMNQMSGNGFDFEKIKQLPYHPDYVEGKGFIQKKTTVGDVKTKKTKKLFTSTYGMNQSNDGSMVVTKKKNPEF